MIYKREDRLTVKEAADYLGISNSVLYKYIQRGEIEYYRLFRNGKIFVSVEALEKLIEEGKRVPEKL